MCGIAGVLDREGRVDLGRLHQMSRLLRHRGPDDEGVTLIDPDGAAHALGGPDTPHESTGARCPTRPGTARRPTPRRTTASGSCTAASRSWISARPVISR